jgi:hypothetical protein
VSWLRRAFSRPERDDSALGLDEASDRTVEIPVDDPARALGVELRIAADRLIDEERMARQRRRTVRHLLTTSVGALVVLAVTGLAIKALTANDEDVEGPAPSKERPTLNQPASLPDSGGDPSIASPRLELPYGNGKRLVARMYLSSRGFIGLAWARHVHNQGVDPVKISYGQPLSILLRSLADRRSFPPAVQPFEASIVLVGNVSSDVDKITAQGPYGRFKVALSESWTPDDLRVPPFKSFIAICKTPFDTRDLSPNAMRRLLYIDNYKVDARLDDGSTIDVPL